MRSTKEGWYVIDGWLSVVGTTTLEIFCKISEDNHHLNIFRKKKGAAHTLSTKIIHPDANSVLILYGFDVLQPIHRAQ